jgi:integrative and conjugative element protein (TIGR02256 family)
VQFAVDKTPIYFNVAERVRRFIAWECSRRFPRETGGILVGKLDGDYALIEYATGPGPTAQHAFQSFKRDGSYSQTRLDMIVARSQGVCDYIGEWHSHPKKVGPSFKDMAAMHWIANNRNYATKYPVMGLCTHQSRNVWKLDFYILDGQHLRSLKPFNSA